MLADKSIIPVAASITNPAGLDVKVPPANPMMEGIGSIPDWQYVADGYVKDASSAWFTVIVTSVGIPGQPLDDGVMVYTAVPVFVPVVLRV